MGKIKNKFIASLVVFTSIISFLPVGFSGQAANAADANADATAITIFAAGTATKLTVAQKSDEVIYSYPNAIDNGPDGFDITVNDLRKSVDVDLIPEAMSGHKNVTGITDQVMNIKSINGVAISNTKVLGEMGIVVKDIVGNKAGVPMLGKQLLNLPYGINKIEYEVIVTTVTVTYVPEKKDKDGNITQIEGTTTGTPVVSHDMDNRQLTIEYGTKFALEKISKLQFKSYVGQESDFAADDTISNDKNNQKPFLYYETGKPDANMPLRYSFNVPDSTFKLKYVMNFQISLADATIYRNGQEDTQANVTEGVDENGYKVSILEGSLEKMGTSALIVIKLNSNSASGAISKSYAIEIKYKTLNTDEDYSLKDAGITKYDYNEIDSVEACIGKKFNVTKDAAGFSIYNGEIYIDPNANMISVDPTLILGKSNVAYKLYNNYINTGSSETFVENALLKSDGKKYVNFKRGTYSNILQIDTYEGAGGNITNSSKILARYLLKVIPTENTSKFTTDLKIEKANNSDTNPYLTQPGVKEDIIDKFTTARRSYDLYYAAGSPVNVTFTGTRSKKNEYLKIWTSTDKNNINPKEATASVNNTVGADLTRAISLNVDLDGNEKMVVQAYYDDFEYNTDANTNIKTLKKDAQGNPIYKSYPLGEKYVFYIPNNFHNTNDPTGEKSDNASLSSLKISGYTLKDSDGNQGFASDKFNYTTSVAKEDTAAKITAIAQDDNIKSIIATVDSSKETFDLVSGELSELPLNTNGKTTIKIAVTAQDEKTIKNYTVVVTNNTKGSTVNLKNVILNVGDYTFDPKADVTKVREDQNVTSVKVTPVPQDSKSKITVNGQLFSDVPINVNIKGAQKTTVNIEVKSEDGTTSKTYTLEINRVDVGDWNPTPNNGEDPNENDQFYDEYSQCWVDSTKYDEWGTVNGKPTYFDKRSRQVKDAWITTGGKLYYLNNLGYRASGWKVDTAGGKTYYLDPTTGEMKKQWMNLDNKWYYLGLNGVMQKGWLNLNNKWYYFTPNGQMVVSQTMYVDDEVCRFGQDGAKY